MSVSPNKSCRAIWDTGFFSTPRFESWKPEAEFIEFKPRLWIAKNRFQLNTGSNLETLNTISSGTNHDLFKFETRLNFFEFGLKAPYLENYRCVSELRFSKFNPGQTKFRKGWMFEIYTAAYLDLSVDNADVVLKASLIG